MMMWIVIGSVLVVVLGLAWLYDRKWGGDPTPRHTPGRAQAESDQAATGFNGGGYGNSGF
ncbi:MULTISPECIES: hypothetical protein [unclassified Phycicoccus]|uniref:hypothetical protein n=1 Tax=unclassified Phycicoccus TaxID=2637926 RepID=UPI000702E5F8|nr:MULTISPECIES: hypothetical protein [unclassified Phycicoccus]KQU69244.1 hypothetical protein ASC58_04905 [Phycicoccus sp. Root101]KQZ90448.1 hypothetical protein ASD62_15335 [Phycicoccus sp. Root563]